MINISLTDIAHKEPVNVTISAADFKQLALKPCLEALSWHIEAGIFAMLSSISF